MDTKDLVALITGGASGLGEACVRSLTKEAMKVSILDFAEEKGRELVSEMGNEAIFCMTDVTDERSVQSAIDKTLQAFGAIHVAINCAGIATPGKVLGKDGPLPIERFDNVVKVNLTGTMNVIRLAAKEMVTNAPNENGEKGVIINTASGAAFEGQIGQAAYSASKAAVAGMTLPIAREFADYGIRVVTIAPGLFETPMLAGLPDKAIEALNKLIPFPKRLGKPSEFAQLALQVIKNPMLNGTTIRLDAALRMAGR